MGEVLVSINPATLEKVRETEIASAAAIEHAMARARAAAREWAGLSVAQRARLLRGVQDAIIDHCEDIVDVVCAETGKPRVEALTGEVFITLYWMKFLVQRAGRVLKRRRVRSQLLKNKRFYLGYVPYGVVGVIAPGNFPFYLSMVSIMPALLAGNTVICKASEQTPSTGLKIEEIFRTAGLPGGVLQVLSGDGRVGKALIAAGVNKIAFTGSVATGRRVAEAAAKRLIPAVLELGGKDAAIVCRDAPLRRAANAAVWGAFSNAGQVCASVERLYVVRDVATELIARVVANAQQLRQGAGSNCDVDVGPLMSARQLSIVESHIEDAVKKGARVLVGGKRREGLRGYFYEPTVLVNVDHSMSVMREETFGPVLPVMVVGDEDEAVALANDSPYGLTASVWTRSAKRAAELSARLQAGTVVINDCQSGASAPELPWGGVKESGYGRYLSPAGLLEFAQTKVTSQDIFCLRRDPFWYPYARRTYGLLKLALPVMFSSSIPKGIRKLLRSRSA